MAQKDHAKWPTSDKVMNFETVRAVLVDAPPLACPLVREPQSGQIAFIVDVEVAAARSKTNDKYSYHSY
jgi:hypothetical protein